MPLATYHGHSAIWKQTTGKLYFRLFIHDLGKRRLYMLQSRTSIRRVTLRCRSWNSRASRSPRCPHLDLLAWACTLLTAAAHPEARCKRPARRSQPVCADDCLAGSVISPILARRSALRQVTRFMPAQVLVPGGDDRPLNDAGGVGGVLPYPRGGGSGAMPTGQLHL
jgi:hypothetical protein